MSRKLKLITCKNCGNGVTKGMKSCPICGGKIKSTTSKKIALCLLIFIIIFKGIDSWSNRSVKFNWNDFILSDKLPEPKSNKGDINSDSGKYLSVDINKMTKDDYRNYVDECITYGYVIEAEVNSNYYKAYNNEGYKLNLSYNESSKELSITIKAPMELSVLKWPENDLTKLLPKPHSQVGKISIESSNAISVYVGNVSFDAYENYIEKCSKAGFNVDYKKYERSYNAYDKKNNYLYISYEGNHVIYIKLEKAKVDDKKEDEKTDVDKDSSKLVDGMRPEFKEAMDKYEKFMNEYIEFMKKYEKSDGKDISLLLDYTSYLSKYADFVEAFEEWEDDDMNAKETKYYIEVQTRINKKLLELTK